MEMGMLPALRPLSISAIKRLLFNAGAARHWSEAAPIDACAIVVANSIVLATHESAGFEIHHHGSRHPALRPRGGTVFRESADLERADQKGGRRARRRGGRAGRAGGGG